MRNNATSRISRWSSIGISLAATASVLLGGCTGGGGGGGGGTSGGSGGGTSGGTTVGGTGDPLLVQAGVTSDTCGERLSDVTQVFRLNGTTLDTSIVSFAMTDIGGSLQGGFSEHNGDCQRNYQVTMTSTGGNTYAVELSSESLCNSSFRCETTWQGTAAPTVEERTANDSSIIEKVNGERCNPDVPNETGYRPSLFECNGNAAVLFKGALRNNYSVVVRRNGAFNDRDPNNPTCGTNRCSPYKTQKRMELVDYQVNCLGASGFSDYYTGVNRISVKFGALVTNPQDTSQFEQWCISPTRSIH